MSYPISSLLPYRSKDLSKEFFEILEADHEWIYSSIEDRGLLFLIALVTLMSMSLLKATVHVITQMQKPVMTYKHLDLHRGMYSESITDTLTRREAIPEVQTRDNLCPNNKVKSQRAETINSLRKYLYQHDLTLHATIIKSIKHKCTDEELLEMYRLGEITKPLSTTHITFGEDLNILLKEVLGNKVDLRRNRFSQESYIRVFNDEFLPIRDALQNLYNEPIKLKLD